jgi:hypothetical protein
VRVITLALLGTAASFFPERKANRNKHYILVVAKSCLRCFLQAVEIRELIIRCLSQMVLARVNNVKSGWKSMFMVFTTAAGDPDPTIVRLAFDTIEKIVREHFGHITGAL